MTEHQFEAARFRDPDVMRLTTLVEAVGDQEFDRRFPNGRPAAVEVVLRTGERLDAVEEVPLGDHSRPMDDAAIGAKFLDLAVPVIGADRAARVIAFVDTLESQPSLDPLLDLCTRPEP